MSAAYAVLSARLGEPLPPEHGHLVARLAALHAWRATQGIYRFDPDLYQAVLSTPLGDTIPAEILFCLPEWCLYVELPAVQWLDWTVHGFWVYLEWHAPTGRTELRFLADLNDQTTPLILHLPTSTPTLAACLEAAIAEGLAQASKAGLDLERLRPALLSSDTRSLYALCLALTLYICSENADLRDSRRIEARPTRPGLIKTKRGIFTPPAHGPKIWETGYRIGAALRTALAKPTEADDIATGIHARPRPHIRRAHWHHFWTGARDQAAGRRLILRWLPPVPIATTDPDSLIPTFHDA